MIFGAPVIATDHWASVQPVCVLISSTCSMLRPRFSPSVGCAVDPRPMQDHCELTCQGDFGALRTRRLRRPSPNAGVLRTALCAIADTGTSYNTERTISSPSMPDSAREVFFS